jgi:hypothetical protein
LAATATTQQLTISVLEEMTKFAIQDAPEPNSVGSWLYCTCFVKSMTTLRWVTVPCGYAPKFTGMPKFALQVAKSTSVFFSGN